MGKKKSDSSEIVLKVKRRIVRVKKGILKKESKYFDSLLSGNYSDSNENEINLTGHVESMDTLKSVVQFMYTGYIYLTSQNIQEVVHLSSYLVIDKLQLKCEDFIKRHLVCEDWLKYYFLASENGLSEVLHYTDAYISSRMHDLLIFEDEMLEIQPVQLQQLRQNGYLKYCTFGSLVQFIAKWLNKSDDMEYSKTAVALKVLENAEKESLSPNDIYVGQDLEESTEEVKKWLMVKSRGGKSNSELMKIMDRVTAGLSCIESKNAHTSDGTGKTDSAKSGYFQAIFAVSEQKSLRRRKRTVCKKDEKSTNKSKTEKSSEMSDLDDDDFFDTQFRAEEDIKATRPINLCVYNAKSDTWYRLEKLNERQYMGHYSGYIYDWTKNWGDDICFDISACNSYIIFEDQHALGTLVFDIGNKTWRCFDLLSQLDYELDDDEEVRVTKFVTCKNLTYLLVCIQVNDEKGNTGMLIDPNVKMIYFRMYKFNAETLERVRLCDSGVYDMPKSTKGYDSKDMSCLISEVRNELVISHYEYRGVHIVLRASLGAHKDERSQLDADADESMDYTDLTLTEVSHSVTEKSYLEFKDSFILETDKSYLLGTVDDENLCVHFRYLFATEEFTEVANGKTKFTKHEEKFMESDKDRFIKAERVWDSKKTVANGSSVWKVENYLRYGNIFQEVKFGESNKTEVIRHRPPPFTKLIAVSAAVVDDAFFHGLEPVTHFLQD